MTFSDCETFFIFRLSFCDFLIQTKIIPKLQKIRVWQLSLVLKSNLTILSVCRFTMCVWLSGQPTSAACSDALSKYGRLWNTWLKIFGMTLRFRLNTDTQLYASLRDVVKNGDKFEEDDVDKRVAELYLFDFEQCGIHLEEEKVRSLTCKSSKYLSFRVLRGLVVSLQDFNTNTFTATEQILCRCTTLSY